jgi:hypothetical protein
MHESTGRGFKHGSLETFYELCRALPGERRDLCKIVSAPKAVDGPAPSLAPAEAARLALLRRRTAHLLVELSKQVEKELGRALSHGQTRWDQVDALVLAPKPAHVLRKELEGDFRHFVQRTSDETREVASAAMREALATLDTVFDLLHLCERRLATFVRLRLQQEDSRLMPDGRPFLDIARALAETAEAYT